jgi:hypothetical protein
MAGIIPGLVETAAGELVALGVELYPDGALGSTQEVRARGNRAKPDKKSKRVLEKIIISDKLALN